MTKVTRFTMDDSAGGDKRRLHLREISGESDAPHFHWYVSIVPRVNKTAGFELGTGMYVNPSLPEICAGQLRDFRAG